MLRCMTVADISALALEYLTAIELIRSKCGRIQEGFSGELRRRIQGLESFVRALQLRAEAAGDPHALQQKIEELLTETRKNRREEERRKREINDLQETIKELRQENNRIREEMRKSFKELRESISTEKINVKNVKERGGYINRRKEEIRDHVDKVEEISCDSLRGRVLFRRIWLID